MTGTPLLSQHCRPLGPEARLSDADVATHLRQAPGWQLSNSAIEKTFTFKDYYRTMAFVNALAYMAHTEDHHPDLAVSYGRCTVRYSTHSARGISINDFICAAKADALFA